ncbi:hypothetical protein [Runella rosea]|nr:hypothetical protein [Runella rosea]
MKNSKPRPKNLINSSVITVIVISLAVCILLIVRSVYTPLSPTDSASEIPTAESANKDADLIDTAASVKAPNITAERAAERAFYKTKFAKMADNFTFAKDDFQTKGWYSHKNFGKKAAGRKTLKAHVREDGFIYLESQFYGNDWIFHTHIKVKVGSLYLSSPKIESYNKNNKQQYAGDTFWENVYYRETGDNGIIQAIADSTSKPVKVRFEGRKFNRDIVLTAEEKQSIKESYELSVVLKKINP